MNKIEPGRYITFPVESITQAPHPAYTEPWNSITLWAPLVGIGLAVVLTLAFLILVSLSKNPNRNVTKIILAVAQNLIVISFIASVASTIYVAQHNLKYGHPANQIINARNQAFNDAVIQEFGNQNESQISEDGKIIVITQNGKRHHCTITENEAAKPDATMICD